MQFSGPLPVSSSNPIQPNDPQLRLNQRLVAEVVEVSGTRIVINVGGTPIVARLEPANQSAPLSAKQVAQFVVTSLTEGEVELRYVNPLQTPASSASPNALSDVTAKILEQVGFEINDENLTLARAMIGQHLTVTPELLDEVKSFLDGLEVWGEAEARLASAIKAAGLPLSVDVLKFAMSPRIPTGQAVIDLKAFLEGILNRNDLPPEIRDAVQNSLNVLGKAVLDWGEFAQVSPEDFQISAQVFGRSLENLLALHLQNGEPLSAGESLLTLANLLQLAKSHNETAIAEKVRSFLEGIQQYHLANVRLDPVPGQGEWCELQFVLKNQAEAHPDFFPAQVRVARREGGEEGGINASSTRLLIQVDIDQNEAIQVDLTLVDKQARAKIITPNATLQERSREEMPDLIQKLRELGYQVTGANFVVGQPVQRELISVLPASELLNRRVNIKV